ncbi:immunoglobulin superfamily member 1-like isoform X1 [Gallus gallus]|uniref:immunoglobulin superfamily member 1-like isoform X1 n=1 Tax=Gallus gallus TaxID=9031 RepID=UPI001AE665B8|nr:immunoglobulin superfamily member 1-like isoform X1 [Gallus gallus]
MSLLVPWKLKAALRPLPFSAAVSLSQAAPASWHQWRWTSSWVSDHGDVLPWGLVALIGTRTVSLAGWWLVAASRAQQLPQHSLSLHPSQGVSLGDTVTLRCHLPQPAAWVELYQDGQWRSIKEMDQEQEMAEFSLAGIKREDSGTYQCQYQGLEPAGRSKQSDPVELLVTDHSYPPPGISLSPKEHVEMGSNITIQCWNKKYGAAFLLHKDGHSAPIQQQDPDDGGTATFTLFGVNTADSSTYRCSYRIGGSYLLFSPLGDNVTLEVIPRPAPPGVNGGPSRKLVAAVSGACVAAIVIIIVLTASLLLVAQRRQMQTDLRPGATSRSPEAMQFQVSPGDSEGLTYAQLQAVTPSTHPPNSSTTPEPPIIYAEVGTRGPC